MNSDLFSRNNNVIYIFTDGSCNNNIPNNQRRCGFGIYFPFNEFKNVKGTIQSNNKTNQLGEVYAMYHLFKQILSDYNYDKNIIIFSDSMYVINCITEYSPKWKSYGWTKSDGSDICHLSYIKYIYEIYEKNMNSIQFIHVRSHLKKPSNTLSFDYFKWLGNKEADKLAGGKI